jgi:uncharacterized protein (TIGR00730 family)
MLLDHPTSRMISRRTISLAASGLWLSPSGLQQNLPLRIDNLEWLHETICVFCGSSPGSRPEYRAATEKLGTEIVRRNIGLAYGGGNVGLMGVLADAVLKAGGEVVGVIPESLMAREVGHNGLTKLHVVRSMHERKALMADLSDAFIALPGGFGTLEEFCEIVTWSQLGLHAKPCGILNIQGYYSRLLTMFDNAVQERFLKKEDRELVLARDSVLGLLQALDQWRPLGVEKWLDRGTR